MCVNHDVLEKSAAICCSMLLMCLTAFVSEAACAGERVVFDNGVTVLMQPVDGVDDVAVDAFYDVGFIHEPAGMTQAAHLLEHLVCFGQTDNFRQKEAMQRVNAIGMANAETLPDHTRYDYILPADQLSLALEVEYERLTSLAFDQTLVRGEATRCYQETDFVEANPASGMIKHAFMAFCQAWRHRADQVQVRGGLEEMTVESLRAFHRQFYRPENLTLVIVGNFQRDEARELVARTVGSIRQPSRQEEISIAWREVPPRQTVRWDAGRRGICLAFPPPADPTSSAAMTLFGTLVLQQLHSDPEIKRLADAAMCTSLNWKANPMPFFVYAAAKDTASMDELERVLKTRFQAVTERTKASVGVIPLLVNQLKAQSDAVNGQMIDQQAQMLASTQGIARNQASRMILGQAAINLATRDRLLGTEPDKTAADLATIAGPRVVELIDDLLDETRMSVTYVLPRENP